MSSQKGWCISKATCTISFMSSNDITKKLSDVLYVLKKNLLLVRAIIDHDLRVHFDKAGAVILDANDNFVARERRCNNLYELSTSFRAQANFRRSKLWDKSVGNLSFVFLKEMKRAKVIMHILAFLEM